MTDRYFWRHGEIVAFNRLQIAAGLNEGLKELTDAERQEMLTPDATAESFYCAKLQGELALLDEPSPTPEHPTMLHWVEATVAAEPDPIRKRTMQAYLNAPTWRSDDPLVPTMWEAAGRHLSELPALFTKAQGR